MISVGEAEKRLSRKVAQMSLSRVLIWIFTVDY